MSGDGTYAPKSPDLSSFYSAGPTSNQSHPPQTGTQLQATQPLGIGGARPLSQQSQSQFSPQQLLHLQPPPSAPYFPEAPRSTYSAHPQLHQQQHQLPASPQSIAQSPSSTLGVGYLTRPPSTQQPYYSSAQPSSQPAQQTQTGTGYTLQGPPEVSPYFQTYGGAPYQQQQQQQQLQHQFSVQQQTYPQQQQQSQQYYGHPALTAQIKRESNSLSPANTMPPRRAAAQAAQPPAIEPSPVKTKFPTARIKRIMQADEEVGKVAQQTPIAVGKALELFMVQLVSRSAEVAREKNSKRVSAQMLKQVVESDEQWDFLRDIVARVENEEKAAKSGGRAKVESESSEEEVVEKKKTTRAGRKKKA